jgi:hypothetical protein
MNTYHVEWSHTSEECHRLLGEMKDKSSYMLDKFYWSCESGHHMGWGIMEAGGEEELRWMLPTAMHSGMKYHKVRRFSDLAADMDRGPGRELHGDLDRGLDRERGLDMDLDLDRDKRGDKEGFEIHNREDFRPKKSA